jgi:hypothetical protein
MGTRKVFACVSVLAVALAACASNSVDTSIVGRWQDTEATTMQLEFTSDGHFSQYFSGSTVDSGSYNAQTGILVLHRSSNCGGSGQSPCDVRLGFTATKDTLIITDAQGDLVFRRVGGTR